MGNGGIYHDGWTVQKKHRTPWDVVSKGVDLELRDATKDWTESDNLGAKQREKPTELQ